MCSPIRNSLWLHLHVPSSRCFNTQDAIQETIIESYHSCEGDLRDNPCSVKHWRAQYVAHTVVSYLCSGTVGTWCRSSVPRSRDGSRIDCLTEAHLESPASIHLGSAPLATFATVKVDMLFSVRLHPSSSAGLVIRI